MELFMNSCRTFGQECLYADNTEQAGHGRKSADSIYYIFRLKPHIRLKDGEERAESQASRRSGEHAQRHIAAIFPLALLDNNVVDSRCDVSPWKQRWCFTVTVIHLCPKHKQARPYLGSGRDRLRGRAARPQCKWSAVRVVEV